MKAARKLTVAVKPIPEGYHTITPFLTVRGADRAIDFYRKAFGAEELGRMNGPDGKTVMHAELKIGDSRVFLGDEIPGMDCSSPETLGGSPSGFYLYVRDVDEAFHKAVAAGATVKRPLENMFWGDRTGSLLDPFGHKWDLATRVEDVPPEEMQRRGAEFFKKDGERKILKRGMRPTAVVVCIVAAFGVLLSAATGGTAEPRLGDIKLPPGFRIAPYADVPNARSMTLGEKGTLFVGTRKGEVYAVLPGDTAEGTHRVVTIARKLQ